MSTVIQAVKEEKLRALKGDDFGPYVKLALELSMLRGCLLIGSQVIFSIAARSEALKTIYGGHKGIFAMKAYERGYLSWARLSKDIEQAVQEGRPGEEHGRAEAKAPLPEWPRATHSWETIYMNFAGPIEGYMFLLDVDSFFKWLEVRQMASIQSEHLMAECRSVFATFGAPRKIVTDSGPSVVSVETKEFLKRNGIKHVTSAPYHPSTNGYKLKQALAKERLPYHLSAIKISF